MNPPTSRLQFFALEAGDYLERLALIVGRPVPPDGEEVVRLTRALRGAALMAGPSGFAAPATSLELVTKQYREGNLEWSARVREIVADAVEELKRLVRQAPEWGDSDTQAAEALAASVGALVGRAPAPAGRPRRDGTTDSPASVRTFIGREAAAVSGTLEHAAQALELGVPSDAYDAALRRLQPIRGLGIVPSFAPLPELLDVLELVLAHLRAGQPGPPLGARALRTAARALTRLARDIADTGRAAPDAPEPAEAAALLLDSFGSERDIVPVESLFHPGDAAPVVHRGRTPESARDAGDGSVALVSLADRLRQAADQLGISPSPVARSLQLLVLVDQLKSARRSPGSEPVATLLDGIVAAVISRGAEQHLEEFADLLRESADRIAIAAETRAVAALPGELAEIVAGLRAIAPVETVPPPDDSDVVPIESLLWSEPRADVVEIPVPEAVSVESDSDIVPIESLQPAFSTFEQSFTTLFRLERRATLSPVEPPVSTSAPEAVTPDHDDDVVAIESLLYRGRRALERADSVRQELSRVMATTRSLDASSPLLHELLDLVPLALAD